MLDYKAKPFHLTDEEAKWVEDTYEGMSLEEKIGQLFCPIVFTKDEYELRELYIEKVQEKNFVRLIRFCKMQRKYHFLQLLIWNTAEMVLL